MKCDLCRQNDATIHYAEVINNKVKKLNICESCAAKKGIGSGPMFPIGELLSGLSPEGVGQHAEGKMCCSLCGLTMDEFKETGRLGCSECYDTFFNALQAILSSIHKGTRHLGKIPEKIAAETGVQEHIEKLEVRLKEAVKNEEFEVAANLRDEIRCLIKKDSKKK